MNNNCYQYEKIVYNDGIFKNIDATYIITLEKGGRESNIKNQLKKYHPSNIVYILYNKGYKNCEKDSYINNTALDIIDSIKI